MANSWRAIRQKELQKHIDNLTEDYQRASRQLDQTLDEVDRGRIQRKIQDLLQQLQETERELKSLAANGLDSSDSPEEDREQLRKWRDYLQKYFIVSELRTLCFDLGIDWENLEGSTKISKIESLIQFSQRYSLLEELIAKCRELRPKIDW